MITNLIADLRRQIADLDDALAEYLSDEVNVEDAANLMLELNLLKTDLSYVYSSVEARMGVLMRNNEFIKLRDGAEIERKMSSSRTKWRHKDIANDVVRRIVQSSIDMDTGEVVMSSEDVAMRMLDFVQPSYWRASKLNEIGINPDNYCESEAKTSVIVRKGNIGKAK